MTFKAPGGLNAVSIDSSGENLPGNLGPWTKLKFVAVTDPHLLDSLKSPGFVIVEGDLGAG
ncbi:hypothetical protein [Aestuariibius insulae]|uniref:hypothetical protein n=1 Tax=Aestuariibius insulae TaxID=2058287 RepID=UPI00398E52FB